MESEVKRVPLVCQHCGYENSPGFCGRANFCHVQTCRGCGRWNWLRVEDGAVKGSGKAYSKCPKKCKIGKLQPEIREKIDVMLIQGVTYQDIAELYPPARHLNGANLSTHNNNHMHPRFRVGRSVAAEERWLAKMNTEKK